MIEANLGFRPLPSSKDTLESHKPVGKETWKPFSIREYAPGTIGHKLLHAIDAYAKETGIPHILEGRMRSSLVLDRPFSELWKGVMPRSIRKFGTMSIQELLHKPIENSQQLFNSSPMAEWVLTDYLRNLAVSPAVVLATDIINIPPRKEYVGYAPVALDQEAAVEEFIARAFRLRKETATRNNFIQRNLDMISMRYGLQTGVPENWETIASSYSITPASAHQAVFEQLYQMAWSEQTLRELESVLHSPGFVLPQFRSFKR